MAVTLSSPVLLFSSYLYIPSGTATTIHFIYPAMVVILGIVLLVFSGLCFLVFTVVGIFVGNLLLGLLIGLPFLLCGLICLLCKKNIGLKCAWAVYLPLWLILTVFIIGGL